MISWVRAVSIIKSVLWIFFFEWTTSFLHSFKLHLNKNKNNSSNIYTFSNTTAHLYYTSYSISLIFKLLLLLFRIWKAAASISKCRTGLRQDLRRGWQGPPTWAQVWPPRAYIHRKGAWQQSQDVTKAFRHGMRVSQCPKRPTDTVNT